jgi:hypothetical protein
VYHGWDNACSNNQNKLEEIQILGVFETRSFGSCSQRLGIGFDRQLFLELLFVARRRRFMVLTILSSGPQK